MNLNLNPGLEIEYKIRTKYGVYRYVCVKKEKNGHDTNA